MGHARDAFRGGTRYEALWNGCFACEPSTITGALLQFAPGCAGTRLPERVRDGWQLEPCVRRCS